METILVDAQQQHEMYPNTFQIPDSCVLDKLKLGDFVKICAGLERFWVEIEEMENETFTGRIDNDLVFVDDHGLNFNSKIKFKRNHIYSTMP